MRFCSLFLFAGLFFVTLPSTAAARTNTVIVRNSDASSGYELRHIPPPSADDAASNAEFLIVDGRRDGNGGDVEKLHDGKFPTAADQPAENFFFDAGTDGGRILIDLGRPVLVDQVNTYSCHPNTRGPQVYKLYVSDGTGDGFNRTPRSGVDPESAGWRLVAEVDTRSSEAGNIGGQHGVSIFDSDGPIGTYRYLLFDVSRTENDDLFGNTFFSEIDVVSFGADESAPSDTSRRLVLTMSTDDANYQAVIDTDETPDLTKWANEELAPVVKEWYPKIVGLLPSDDYEAPRSFSVRFAPSYRGVAATGGTRVRCAPQWFRRNLQGEAKGAVVHELVHVVQQYGRARRNRGASRPPGWLVEGIADYIRWFLYEPQSHGAEITQRNLARARYDASYRISANFLNWVTLQYDREIVAKLNAALREGRYNEDLWSQSTGRTLAELGDEWRSNMERQLADEQTAEPSESVSDTESGAAQVTPLTAEEQKAGWVRLFDGRTFEGWHSFRTDQVRPGWQIKGGALTCVDPHNAGDLCTNAQYDWFELRLEYKISEGGNSGIMFHVTNEEQAAWATGPEFQLEDNAKAPDPIRCGWLYALYQPPLDPHTNKPLDATMPAGTWNQVRLIVSPEKCVHEINGIKYLEYVLGSEDFADRVAKSKFGRMPRFAKTGKGYIALQGDHGQIAFRNVKLRPIIPNDTGEELSAQVQE